jgi:ribosome recycling factor
LLSLQIEQGQQFELLNPSNDGRVIRIAVPALSEETRIQLIKLVKEKAELANVSLRNGRHEALNTAKTKEKAKELTQDQVTKLQKAIDSLIDTYNKSVQAIVVKKEQELMSV